MFTKLSRLTAGAGIIATVLATSLGVAPTAGALARTLGATAVPASVARKWVVSAGAVSVPTCATASAATPFPTIPDALECAHNGDTVKVGAGTFAGPITIAANITLTGAGATKTTIANPAVTARIPDELTIADGTSVRINGLTINGFGSLNGAAPQRVNGGILAGPGQLTIQNSVVTNTLDTGVPSAAIAVNDTNGTSNVNVYNSTINANITGGAAGGIAVANPNPANPSNLLVANTTIDTNAGLFAGGIYTTATNLTLDSDTLTANTGTGPFAATLYTANAPVTIVNSILALGQSAFGTDCNATTGTVTAANNIIGGATNTDGCGLTNNVNGNQVGTPTNPLNPDLAPLAPNGGPTQTRALLPASPAINAGNPTACTNAPINNHDQRGTTRNTTTRTTCDIGAYDTGGNAPSA